ncbi:hypothetical protein R0L47_19245 [Pectobacterium polonicum]|uniref:Uncharacterized protein n=1 Tax=Pectobacterium polonicum TaxID=2485124 RepID=A0AAE9SZU2_9GAMM|nr:hypothetical protein [Pectobacterium polonicum]TKY80346.1 hypothetical protein EDI29_21575 [Pectobacterium polonicum]UVO08510.1 hypothetical protein LW347_00405 [Pectobacterium polonicum]GKW24791.1 hypothetical protein PEC311524_23850 [Pectobacterium carotovorum subsp. carotovorum]
MSLFMQLRTFFLFIITLLAFPVLAQSSSGLTCGIYTNDSGVKAYVISPEILQKKYKNEYITSHYTLDSGKVNIISIDTLNPPEIYELIEEKEVKDFNEEYTLTESKSCKENIGIPKSEIGKKCWDDMEACSWLIAESDVKTLKQLCQDNFYLACQFWDNRVFFKNSISKMSENTENRDIPQPSDPEWIETLTESCRSGLSEKMCTEAARSLWNSGQYLAARDALQLACNTRIWDNSVCQQADDLRSLTENDISSSVSGLPVGHYATRGGDVDFIITKNGTVIIKGSPSVKAHIDNGLIRIPRDLQEEAINRRSDFLFRRAGENKLISLDIWNTFKVYELQN